MSTLEMVYLNELGEAHSPIGQFELPCGYVDESGQVHRTARLREMRGHEEDMLASPKIPTTTKFLLLLQSCIEAIGPYEGPEQIRAIVPKLYLGDRLFLMFALRRVTLGDRLPYRAKCPECKQTHKYVVDLSLLDIKKMPHPEQRLFSVKLPSGCSVSFRNLTGVEELDASKVGDQDRASAMLGAKIVALNDMPPTLKDIKDLSFKDRLVLRRMADMEDGGLDTDVQFICKNPTCGVEFTDSMDMTADFFYPSMDPPT